MRHLTPVFVSWSLRAMATLVVVTLVGVGCFIDRSGLRLPTSVFSCSVTVQNSAGATRVVRDDDAVLQALSPRVFLSDSSCPASGTLVEDFERWVSATIPARYDGEDGPWCVQPDTVVCEDPVPAEEPIPACPAPIATAPTYCVEPTRCLNVAPSEVDYPALLTAAGESETRSLLGLPEGRLTPLPRVSVANTCPDSVRVFLDDSVQGDHPDDFAILNNTCAPRPGTDEDRLGRELLAAGSGGEECGFEVQFTPTQRAMRRAEKVFSQATTLIYNVPFSGSVRGGTLAGLPGSRCFDTLTGPRLGCLNATAAQTLILTNISPARMTVDGIVATGAFQTAGPTPPFVLEPTGSPGDSQSIDVFWCGDGGDVDDSATLLITHNGFMSPAEVTLERLTAGCP